jgi:hypothetical protein
MVLARVLELVSATVAHLPGAWLACAAEASMEFVKYEFRIIWT